MAPLAKSLDYKVTKKTTVYTTLIVDTSGNLKSNGFYTAGQIVTVSDIIQGPKPNPMANAKRFDASKKADYAVLKTGPKNLFTGYVLLSDLDRVLTEAEEKEKKIQEIKDGFADSTLDDEIIDTMIENTINATMSLTANTKLFGQPFQFSDATDLRVYDATIDMGRMYTETFIAEAPVVSILPGNANFLPNMSDEDKNKLLDYWESAGFGGQGKSLDFLQEILNQEERYFEFTSDYVSYMQYVNLMCRMSSVYMGLDKYYIQMEGHDKMPFKLFDWKHYRYGKIDVENLSTFAEDSPFEKIRDVTEAINLENFMSHVKETFNAKNMMEGAKKIVNSVVGERNHIDFYVDPGTSFQETSSNQTAQSQLASLFETAQGFSKEMYFYRGMLDNGGISGQLLNTGGAVLDAGADLTKIVGNALSGGLLGKLFGAASTVIGGGNVMFPEIWGDSNYNKSYSVNINLVSPYGTPESVYVHVLVPLFHLMALALPRQITSNGFAQPFMVKVTSKGWFSCEMGMIDSISIEKVQGSYTVNGIPTEIKVSLSIRDLYSDLMITPATKPGLFYANRGLGNWLAVTSGLDITQPAYVEKWTAILWALVGGATSGVSNIYDRAIQGMQNALGKLLFME